MSIGWIGFASLYLTQGGDVNWWINFPNGRFFVMPSQDIAEKLIEEIEKYVYDSIEENIKDRIESAISEHEEYQDETKP